MSALSEFKRNGYFIARNLVDKASIQETLSSINKSIIDQLRFIGVESNTDDVFTNFKALFHADLERYKKLIGALWRKQSVFDLMHNPSIVQFLADEFGMRDLFLPGGQVLHLMAEDLKIPGSYFGLVPHQDFPSVQGSLDGVVVWMPLTDVNKDNFPIEVLPASHLRGVWPMIDHGSSTWEVDPSEYDPNDFTTVEARAGDVVFMSMFTIHRSVTEGAPGQFRIAASTRFDNADELTFIDRTYPTAYLRSVRREPYVPNFPTVPQVLKIFD